LFFRSISLTNALAARKETENDDAPRRAMTFLVLLVRYARLIQIAKSDPLQDRNSPPGDRIASHNNEGREYREDHECE
jgi:hypothetical protein